MCGFQGWPFFTGLVGDLIQVVTEYLLFEFYLLEGLAIVQGHYGRVIMFLSCVFIPYAPPWVKSPT